MNDQKKVHKPRRYKEKKDELKISAYPLCAVLAYKEQGEEHSRKSEVDTVTVLRHCAHKPDCTKQHRQKEYKRFLFSF